MYLGMWQIDDLMTFTVVTHAAATGALTDADSVPSYRVYEDETGTAILTGSMAKLDDTNTTGHYSEQITLSAANGFEVGKSYSIYITATVSSVAGGAVRNFQVEAAPATAAALTTLSGLVDDLEGRLTAARAGYLDSLNSGVPLSAAAIDAILDDAVEGSLTLRQILRILLAGVAGESTGGGGSTINFRDVADTKNRISATVDANRNRTAVTLDGS